MKFRRENLFYKKKLNIAHDTYSIFLSLEDYTVIVKKLKEKWIVCFETFVPRRGT